MDPAFWLNAWEEGKTGFHKAEVHPDLVRHAEAFLGSGRHRVLVPLCGMTLDLAWLVDRGHEVVGVELAERAVHALHAREGTTPTVEPLGPFQAYRTPGRTVLQGDVFELSPAVVGTFDRVWDRAALIALDPERRARYVRTLRSLLTPGSVVLLVTMDFEQAKKPGPPHAVPESEVRMLWAGGRVEKVDEHDILEEARLVGISALGPRFRLTLERPRPDRGGHRAPRGGAGLPHRDGARRPEGARPTAPDRPRTCRSRSWRCR